MATQKIPDLKALEDELLARVSAQQDFGKWIEYRQQGALKPAKHHQLIIDELMKVESGETKRLMLIFPPGSAKSTYSSMEFPPWYLGKNPGKNIIAASHTYDLAERFGRKARNIVGAIEFKNVFETTLSADSAAAGQWETSRGSEYFAAGVGGSITGRRADLGLIDDPVKSKEAAESEREREKAWDWYVNDFETRLKPDSRQILIQTRWHEDDLAGRILNRDGAMWKVIRVPMECDGPDDPLGRAVGERLWAEWFTEEMVNQAKKDLRTWNALYQGNPIPEEGNFFKKEWFVEYGPDDIPSTLNIYGACDYAVTAKSGDYTELGIFGVDWDGDVWVLDWWFGQTDPEEWIDNQCSLILTHKPLIWFGEAGPVKRAIEPFLKKRMETRQAYCHLEWLASIHDKKTRARGIQSLASMGKVKIPKNKPWINHVMTQILQFDAGRHDDAVDVFSLIGRGLDFVQSAGQPKKRKFEHMPSQHAWLG
jgi:predicted phage terminase large subunit-like protein